MITGKEIWDFEKARLERVVKEIRLQLDRETDAVVNFKKEAIELQKKMWEEVKLTTTDLTDLEGAAQVWQYQTGIANEARKYQFSFSKVTRLEKMLQSAYFGRIDFAEDGEASAEQIYIGIHNLITGNNREILVYDWRAPISGMFYDFENGTCRYDCPSGTISGQMLLKRQYKISGTNILYMFDSSLSINDEMLKEILGKSTDSRMKTIVTSIQREQNTVIRNSGSRTLIVEGPAGSGKTSIALHRAAYLLYKFRDSITADNILVFSPNHVFEDYISNVLPDLGEEEIKRSTFIDYFRKMLDSSYRIESMNGQMEDILSCSAAKTRLLGIRLKASAEFLSMLKKYVWELEGGEGLEFKSLVLNGTVIISSNEIYKLFINDYSYFTYSKRLEKLRQRLFYLLEKFEEDRVMKAAGDSGQGRGQDLESGRSLAEKEITAEYEVLKEEIIKMTSFDIYRLYIAFLSNMSIWTAESDLWEPEQLQAIGTYTVSRLSKGVIDYEDTAPIIYLKTALDSVSEAKAIKHVIIDEAQDYTVIHYEIFRRAFANSDRTILGDENQSVNGYMNVGNFENIYEVFGGKAADSTESIRLTKSYRSSKEIAGFCKQLLLKPDCSEQLDRHGNKPVVIRQDKAHLKERLASDIMSLKNRGHKLIAVICKTAAQCEALFSALKPLTDISLVSNKNEEYQGGAVIIPSYLAKGLEFDAVLVSTADEEEYSRAEDRRLLYTVCTRALHELYLYYCQDLSGFIKEMDGAYYTCEVSGR
ncbi:helicase IV [Ruminiclostridium hungatei]|uniref:Helicase IV n=1 Tax=Ruminiclostridium hungatei TaxID=48256 RepID=A0A1V4SHE9_RUMHU|nr:UvrD-helicase domain-containing protein [Ruminiclostridium hungatei]OPX42895.1 helicase IV [Ruminiclostridium hungatei]